MNIIIDIFGIDILEIDFDFDSKTHNDDQEDSIYRIGNVNWLCVIL